MHSWSTRPFRAAGSTLATIRGPGCGAGLASSQLSSLLPRHALASAMPDIPLSSCTEPAKYPSSACQQLGHQAHSRCLDLGLPLLGRHTQITPVFNTLALARRQMKPPIGHVPLAPGLAVLFSPPALVAQTLTLFLCHVCSWVRPPSSSQGFRTR